MLGGIARQAAISIDLIRLKPLESYPVFSTELSSQAKTEEIPQSVTERLMPIRVTPTQKPYDVELSEPIRAPAATTSRLSNWQLAVLGGLGAAVLVVFLCLAALILLTEA